MHTRLRCLALFLLLALTGCNAVLVTEPVGDEPVTLETGKWQGTWLSREFTLITTVLDAEAGLLQAAWLERGQDGANMEVYRGHVRSSGEWLFISMPKPPPEEVAQGTAAEDGAAGEDGVAEYFWARLSNDGRTAVVWWPSVEAFRAAVREGRLPGIVKEDDDVRLGELQPDHLALINAPASGLLGWEEPMVFVRIAD
jgi:hypothetical protein